MSVPKSALDDDDTITVTIISVSGSAAVVVLVAVLFFAIFTYRKLKSRAGT